MGFFRENLDLPVFEHKKDGIYLGWKDFFDHFGISTDSIETKMFDRFQNYSLFEVRIDDKRDGNTYVLGEKTSRLTVLHIHDLEIFLENFRIIQNLVTESKRGMWVSGNIYPSERIWNNASLYDFEHPEDYLYRIIYQILDKETFSDLHDWTVVGEDNDVGTFCVKYNAAPFEYESPDELLFARTVGESSPQEENNLAVIRYGRVGPKEVVIYAIQMPTINGNSRTTLKEHEKEFDFLKERLLNLASSDSKFKSLFEIAHIDPLFETSADILSLYNQIYLYFVNHVSQDKRQGEQDHKNRDFDKWLVDFLGFSEVSYLYDCYEVASTFPDVDAVKKVFDQRDANISQMNKFFRIKEKSDHPHVGDSGLKEISPGLLMSFLLSLKMFREKGITEVTIPMFFPTRQHVKDLGIDEKIYRQKLFLVLRAVYEMEGGIEIIPTSIEEGCIRLRLHEPFTPKRKELKNIFQLT